VDWDACQRFCKQTPTPTPTTISRPLPDHHHHQPTQVLKARGVKEDKILFLSMIAAPQAIHRLCGSYPDMKMLTSEVDKGLDERYRIVPGVGEFGQRYFSD
jgi:uracil phosphoribosyltransferase